MTIVDEAGRVTRHGTSAKRGKAGKSEAKPTTCALCGATPNKLVDSHGNLVCEPCAQAVGMDQQVGEVEAPKRTKKQKADEPVRTPDAPADPLPRTLAALAEGYAAQMKTDGKTDATIASYANDLALAVRELGPDTLVAELTAKQVLAYFESEPVTMLRTGGAKSELSIAKTRRVLRLALDFAVAEGWIEKTPVPERA